LRALFEWPSTSPLADSARTRCLPAASRTASPHWPPPTDQRAPPYLRRHTRLVKGTPSGMRCFWGGQNCSEHLFLGLTSFRSVLPPPCHPACPAGACPRTHLSMLGACALHHATCCCMLHCGVPQERVARAALGHPHGPQPPVAPQRGPERPRNSGITCWIKNNLEPFLDLCVSPLLQSAMLIFSVSFQVYQMSLPVLTGPSVLPDPGQGCVLRGVLHHATGYCVLHSKAS
jgi:hypothetical protein